MTTTEAWWKEPTRAQWTAFFAAWIGWVLDAFDFTIFLLVMPAIAKEFGVGVTQAAGSITLTLLLRLLGGYVAGAAGDRWGRKLPLMISMIWFALCDGAVAFAPSFGWVLVLRTLFGFGMGAEWTAGATLAMENWPARSRGIASGILQGSWAVGYFLAAAASAVVVPAFGWRALFLIAAAPALLALPIRIWVPESEEWREKVKTRASASWRELKSSGTIGTIAWASIVMAFGFGGYYGFTGLYPTMLEKELHLAIEARTPLVMIFQIGMLIGAVICGYVASRTNYARALIVAAALATMVLPVYVGFAGPSLLAAGSFFGGAFGAGMCGITPLFLTGLFPAHIRARAVGIVYHAGAFAAAFVPTGIAALSEYAGLSLANAILYVSAVCEVGLVLSLVLRRSGETETATGMEPSRV